MLPEIVASFLSFSKTMISAPGALLINSSMMSPVSSSLLWVSLKSSLDTVDQTILYFSSVWIFESTRPQSFNWLNCFVL